MRRINGGRTGGGVDLILGGDSDDWSDGEKGAGGGEAGEGALDLSGGFLTEGPE